MMIQEEFRGTIDGSSLEEHSCIIIGHRSRHLPWKYDESDPLCIKFKEMLFAVLEFACKNNIMHWYTEMSEGIGLLSAQMILDLKESQFPNVQLRCILPYKGQEETCPLKSQERYRHILQKADIFEYHSDHDYRKSRSDCTKKILDRVDCLIAVYHTHWNRHTVAVKYARKIDMPIVFFDPLTLKSIRELPFDRKYAKFLELWGLGF